MIETVFILLSYAGLGFSCYNIGRATAHRQKEEQIKKTRDTALVWYLETEGVCSCSDTNRAVFTLAQGFEFRNGMRVPLSVDFEYVGKKLPEPGQIAHITVECFPCKISAVSLQGFNHENPKK